MNDYHPETQFEQYVVDELRHLTNHLGDVEREVKGITRFVHQMEGKASILGAFGGLLISGVAWLFTRR